MLIGFFIDREGITIFASMGKAETSRIFKAWRCLVDEFRDECQGGNGPWPHALYLNEVLKSLRAGFVDGPKHFIETFRAKIARRYIVFLRHGEDNFIPRSDHSVRIFSCKINR
jgi:hypothetical protein